MSPIRWCTLPVALFLITIHALRGNNKQRRVEYKAATILEGDQLEAASPMDPSFWTIHPTTERLWVYKKLSGTFQDETWPSKNSRACFNCHCYGHAPGDIVPFKIALAKETGIGLRDATSSISNQELYEMADPFSKHLPYIYDRFDWVHCAKEGFNFATITTQ